MANPNDTLPPLTDDDLFMGDARKRERFKDSLLNKSRSDIEYQLPFVPFDTALTVRQNAQDSASTMLPMNPNVRGNENVQLFGYTSPNDNNTRSNTDVFIPYVAEDEPILTPVPKPKVRKKKKKQQVVETPKEESPEPVEPSTLKTEPEIVETAESDDSEKEFDGSVPEPPFLTMPEKPGSRIKKAVDRGDPNYRYWNHLEHSWFLPGSSFEKTVMQGVDRELQHMRMMQNQGGYGSGNRNSGSSYGQARIEIARRNNIKSAIHNLIQNATNGYYDTTDGVNVERIRDKYERMKQEYLASGGLESEIDDLPELFGKRNDALRTRALDDLQKFTDAESVLKGMERYIDPETGESKTDPKAWQAVADSYIELLAGAMKRATTSSMGENDKVRVQYLALSDNDRAKVAKVLRDYYKSTAGAMRTYAMTTKRYDTRSTAEDIARGLESAAGNADTNDSEWILTGVETLAKGLNRADNIPMSDLGQMLNGYKDNLDTYLKTMIMDAQVSPQFVYELARTVANNRAESYNGMMRASRRNGADVLTPRDVSKWNIQDYTPDNSLFVNQQPRFPVPKTPGIPNVNVGDVPTNPESKGTNNERTGDSKSHVYFAGLDENV